MAERLHNGLECCEESLSEECSVSSTKPMPVPYLENRPAVIPINTGRQLFVDDFLIDETTLRRRFHQAHKHGAAATPAVSKDSEGNEHPFRSPKSGGLWWDTKDQLFKMWKGSPADAPFRPRLRAFLQRAAEGLKKTQDPETGLWRNVLNHPDARLESSGTSTFTYTYALALNQGWVDDDGISEMVRNGLRGLKRVYWQGGFGAWCHGTAIGDTSYYLSRAQSWGPSMGFGSVLSEVAKMEARLP